MESLVIENNSLAICVDKHKYELPLKVKSVIDFDNEIAILTEPNDQRFHTRFSSSQTCNLFVFSKQSHQILWTYNDVLFIEKRSIDDIIVTILDFQIKTNIHTGKEVFSREIR